MDVAIVGAGCRLPGGADTPTRLWALLCDGVDAITEVPPDRFDVDALFDPDPGTPGTVYTRWGGFLDDVDGFDAGFFGISPREARRVDPQQRLLLEVTWEALEDGGQPPDRLAGSATGVFVGASTHDYADLQGRPPMRTQLDAYTGPGGALSILANRISYALDLHGPSFVVDTACSSSLTALHLACRSLAEEECGTAIVGGVNVILDPTATIMFCQASMLSPDGRCKSFDASANGYVRSEGAVAVVLKPLARALADRDPVYAVIRSTAVNQDGRTAGISVPSAEAQQRLLRRAVRAAGLAPGDVQYIEAHGTGTPVGDPREAAAIGAVYGAGRPDGQPCRIGSAKSNLGHLEAAAGLTGLLKAALALRHRRIPPSLHFSDPNPAIDFDDLGLRVVTAAETWPADPGRAVAGVNAFGFGGANAHAVLAEPPPRTQPSADGREPSHRVLTLSARTPAALHDLAAAWVPVVEEPGAPPLRDLCHTAAVRRSHHPHRLAVVAGSREELVAGLRAFLADEPRPGVVVGHATAQPRTAFVFSGMGPQTLGMGRRLLREEPAFRQAVEACDEALSGLADWSLQEVLDADDDGPVAPDRAHVTNLALQLGLVALWRSWGVLPDAVVGHSSGETGAACVAGALDLADAVRLALHRGRLLRTTAGTGGMLAAAIPSEVAERLVADRGGLVSLAAVNAPASVTLSGDVDALAEVRAALEAQGRWCRPLAVDIPYHAPQLDALEEDLLAGLAEMQPRRPRVPIVSTTTGEWVDGELLDARHWWRNLRQPVRFATAVQRLAAAGHDLFVELSPHPVLTPSIQACLSDRRGNGTVVPTLRRGEDDRDAMLRALAAIHVRGGSVDWSAVQGEGAVCTGLPHYPWQRERHWFDPAPDGGNDHLGAPLPGRRLRGAVPIWECDLGDARMAYLDDHVVRGRATFPGAGHVVLALVAAGAVQGGAATALHDVTFDSLLRLDARADTLLQCVVDPEAGTVAVHSGLKAGDSDWKPRATARLDEPPGPAASADLAAIRQRCTATVPVDRFYGEAESYLGLTYRGPFRSITELRTGPGEALARVAAEPPLDAGEQPVHPALLDAAFQALLAAHRSRADSGLEPGVTILPVGIDRVERHGTLGSTFWSHASVGPASDGHASDGHASDGERDGEVLAGAVELLDDRGQVALICRGLRLRVLHGGRPAPGDCLQDEVWVALPERRGALDAPTPARLAEAVGSQLERLTAEAGYAGYYEDVEPALDAMAARLVRQALAELGWDGRDDGATPLPQRLGVSPRHRRYLERLVELQRGLPAGPPDADGVLGDPALRPAVELVQGSGERLAATLRDQEDARRWLVAGEAAGSLADFYSTTPIGRFYNAALAEALAAARPSGRNLRILEVGAGTGATTAAVLDRLDGQIADYLVTDVSPYFVKHARRRFGERPGVRFGVLDLDERLEEVQPPFDAVIAGNVIHATADVRATLANVRRVLAPGGLIMMLEPIRRVLWIQLLFGQLEGWWAATDADLRPTGPLLDLPRWRQVLEEVGFRGVEVVADAPADGGEPLQALLLAQVASSPRSAGRERPARRWLVLADGRGVGARVAAGLRARGDHCVLVRPSTGYRRRGDDRVDVDPGAEDDWTRLLREHGHGGAHPPQVVHLWGLDSPAAETLTGATALAAQDLSCGAVVALLRAAQRHGLPLGGFAFVTAGAQQAPGEDGGLSMAQTPLWGLARVLRNERRGQRCLSVDLSETVTDAEVDALLEELVDEGPIEQPELVLRDRVRHGRRLRPSTLAATERPRRRRAAPDDTPLRLALGPDGRLESLRLVEGEPGELGPAQVEIRVHAAALNFRDVMAALGLVRHGTHAPALGLDCAGVVVAAEGADGLRRGDEVVAIAKGALASRVVTEAAFVARKPPGLSFSQAATLPVAFATARTALHEMAAMAAGERALVHTASGGVGLAALQLCRRAGVEVLATAGTPEKRDFLRSLGIEHVMDSRTLDFAEQVREVTGGEGVDIVLNSLVGEGREASLDLLRPSGRFVDMAVRDMIEDRSVGLRHFARGLSYHAIGGEVVPASWSRHLREIVEDVAVGALRPLPAVEYDLADAGSAFRLMAQARHIGKVVCTVEEPHYWVEQPRPRLFRGDGTYLLVGGLGGLGLAMARWMVRRGARHLVLTSRSGRPHAEDRAALEDLQRSAADVRIMRADAVDREAMDGVLASIRAGMPPLRGVVHAAMALDDELLGRVDQERFRAVLAPKVAGAWNVHELTADDDLELFLLCSSVSSVIGAPAQSSYAAANAFLDAFAAHRRSLGLPALTVNWGAVGGVGYVARNLERFSRFTHAHQAAVRILPTDVAFAALERALGNDVTRVVIGEADWSSLLPGAAGVPAGGGPAASTAQPPRGRDDGTGADSPPTDGVGGPSRDPDVLRSLVRRAALVFDTSPDRVDPDRALTDMGLDSLMAVELQTMIEKDLGIEVPIVDLLEGAALRGLAADVGAAAPPARGEG